MPKSSQRPTIFTASRAGNRHRQNPLLLWRPDGVSGSHAPRSSRLADFLDRNPRCGPPSARCTRQELAQILDLAMEIASGRRDPRMGAMTTATSHSASQIGAMVMSSSTQSESSADETQSQHSNNAESADADSSNEAQQEQ